MIRIKLNVVNVLLSKSVRERERKNITLVKHKNNKKTNFILDD